MGCKSLFILLESSYVLLATGFGLDLKFGDKKFSVTTKLAETLLNPLDYMAPNPPEKMDIPSTKKRKLIIHFDLNETILVEDAAGGDTREDCFNKILAKNAFVRIPTSKSEQPSLWWDGTPLTLESQDDITLNHEEYLSREEHEKMIQTLVDKLFIGWEWPSGCVPYYKVYKGRSKTFTEHHGHIFRPLLEQMRRRLSFSHPSSDISPQCMERNTNNVEFAHVENGGIKFKESRKIDFRLTTDEGESHFILPAFFHTLDFLEASGREYVVVFRTFGHDLPLIAAALEAFSEGKHPMYPRTFVQESKDSSDQATSPFLLKRSQMFRGRYNEDACKKGGVASNPLDCAVYQLHEWTDDEKDQFFGKVKARNDEEVIGILENSDTKIFGINDDYKYWSSHGCHPECGKPVWVHADQDGKLRPHHIFFDDNIKNDPNDSIVAVRQESLHSLIGDKERKFHSLSGTEIQALHGIHLVRVPTFKPLLEPDWFIRQIEKCEENLASTMQHDSQHLI